MRHKRRLHRFRSKRTKRIIILLFIFAFLAFIIDHQMRPLIKSIALNRAQITSTKVINEVVLEEVSRLDIDYSEIAKLQKDETGKILSIEADMKKINMLKSGVTMKIQDRISSMSREDLSVPIGTLTGTEILNGRGPQIRMKVTLSGSVLTNFRSEFESAGINQTKHHVYLDVSTEVFALIPGYPVTTAVNTSILIAESIFMGDVPKVYMNTSG